MSLNTNSSLFNADRHYGLAIGAAGPVRGDHGQCGETFSQLTNSCQVKRLSIVYTSAFTNIADLKNLDFRSYGGKQSQKWDRGILCLSAPLPGLVLTLERDSEKCDQAE